MGTTASVEDHINFKTNILTDNIIGLGAPGDAHDGLETQSLLGLVGHKDVELCAFCSKTKSSGQKPPPVPSRLVSKLCPSSSSAGEWNPQRPFNP